MSLNNETKPNFMLGNARFFCSLQYSISYEYYCYILIILVIIILYNNQPIGLVIECFPMAQEIRVQSQVESYQKLNKWYLIPSFVTLSIIKYI